MDGGNDVAISLAAEATRGDSDTQNMPTDYNIIYDRFPSDVRERFEKTLAEAVRQGYEQLDRFTEAQMVEAMKQALLSGDFTKLVVANTPAGAHTQAVVYIPFAREQELEGEVKRLRAELERLRDCVGDQDAVIIEDVLGIHTSRGLIEPAD